MRTPNKIKISEVGKIIDSADALICSASFEERCILIPEQLQETIKGNVHVYFASNISEVEKNKLLIEKMCAGKSNLIPLKTNDPIFSADQIHENITALFTGAPKNIAIDLTSFTHEHLLILIKLLSMSARQDDIVKYCYVLAKDYAVGLTGEDKWLSKGVSEVRTVIGYPGEILPLKSDLLILLSGFESSRATRIIEEFETEHIAIGLGKHEEDLNTEHHEVNRIYFERIIGFYENSEMFEFSCYDVDATKKTILDYAKKYAEKYNIIVAPMNNKLSTVGVALAAIQEPRIQICYSQANQYNYKGYSDPSDNCIVFDIFFS